ncbi:MAG TPA: SH3 domain-containing protein [Sphingomonas sp.]|nr:SH3 domain-containing protein [Sphingomonas sp.]
MKNSGISSQTATPRPSGSPTRDGFALTGRSVTLDPSRHAVRPDLADIRLAAQVFAPRYAAPFFCRMTSDADLRGGREPTSATLATLVAGDAFEVLEFSGTLAWGVAPGPCLVGYVPAAALACA